MPIRRHLSVYIVPQLPGPFNSALGPGSHLALTLCTLAASLLIPFNTCLPSIGCPPTYVNQWPSPVLYSLTVPSCRRRLSLSMATVLILSRDNALFETLSLPLKAAGFATSTILEPSQLPVLTVEEFPDIVLLDISLLRPEEKAEAIEFCRSAKLPTLALLRTTDISSGHVPAGIDDFLIGPPNPSELVARVHQLIRRLRGRDGQQVLRIGDLLIDQSRYEVTLAGRRVILTFKEYELLRLLASTPGRVFKREELLSKIWEYDYFGGTRTVDVHIRRLRSKVEDAHHHFIETIWNVGYRLKDSEN